MLYHKVMTYLILQLLLFNKLDNKIKKYLLLQMIYEGGVCNESDNLLFFRYGQFADNS